MKPKLLNGCCKSVALAEAFEEQGWDAWTCDIQPSEGWHKHIQDNVLNHLDDGWDMAVFHPDCTYLANSGVRWYHERQQQELTKRAADFFNLLLNAAIPLLCVENPIQHRYAREFIPMYDQIFHPHYFGELESKATCLWLRGLPQLVRTHYLPEEIIQHSVWQASPSNHRKADRARNFIGVSRAMAKQWSHLNG